MSLRSSIPGTQRTRDGADNLVQKDEPDPLGTSASVVQVLRQRGLPVEQNLKLRNRFMLSSTTFSPTLFLSQVHNTASTEALLQGLDFLSRSIEKKSASLKVLVESNFERFVRAKATIDNVYTEMRNQGAEPEARPVRKPHSRHTSKSSAHFRTASGPLSPTQNKTSLGDKKKNALTKDSEYGVQGIKAPLIEVAVKAEEVWGPALGGREREESLKAVLATVEKYSGIFEVGASIQGSIKRNDSETLVKEYTRARKYAIDAKAIADSAVQNRSPLTDPQTHQIIVTARMWSDVEDQITLFKRDIWKKLAAAHTDKEVLNDNRPEAHLELIGILLELGVDENPIWIWLLSRYDYLRNKIIRTSERYRVEVEVMRRRLANEDRPSLRLAATSLRSAAAQSGKERANITDAPKIAEFWEQTHTAMNVMLSVQGGRLGEVIEFWEAAQSFIDGNVQKTLPVGIDGQSRRHHKLSSDEVVRLQHGASELLDLIRDSVFSFFADPPIEDISALFSPVPPTPTTPSSAELTPINGKQFTFDPKDIPPSPKRGDAWEKFAFWSPYANSLSGVHYLSGMLVLIGTAASEMGSLSVMKQSNRQIESLRNLVGSVRERCVQAVCAAWNTDAENCKTLEDWTRSPDRHDLTNMPTHFMGFETAVLGGMQRILYISDAMNRSGSAEVVVSPSAKLLKMLRSQFVTSLYKALSGMVENAEKRQKWDEEFEEDDADDLTIPARSATTTDFNVVTIEATNRNVRILLTLSNLQALRSEIVPHLITQFESAFSIKLTEESKTIRDVLSQIDAKLFQTYTSPAVNHLASLVTNGITDPTWVPQTARPSDAKPYVYDVLLSLVLVHTEVSTTASSLTGQVLSYLLEQLSLTLISAFKERDRYTLAGLMQATLDVEFLAQTLNLYTTEKAAETQSQIYLALDERTDNEARMKLQGELPEMRRILKGLREGTKGEL
ncbi:hypothetical protein B0A49_05140 [Cryomyces minteri]|uniref:Exocyst complex component SEC5 n=1 Tax=Cryomyces minteri TaxID=331657 RepID=A0A4U0XAT7_9PEZI|nr:hypothetical protein B0A49_05140 [Cryomyces minteri]